MVNRVGSVLYYIYTTNSVILEKKKTLEKSRINTQQQLDKRNTLSVSHGEICSFARQTYHEQLTKFGAQIRPGATSSETRK